MESTFMIGQTPAVLYGEDRKKLFLFIHGQGGNKEEAKRFADIASPFGFQVLGIDLPEHGERNDGANLLPWEVIPELKNVLSFTKERWEHISVRAISIGAWYSLLAFAGEPIEKCLLSSPLLDMENMITGMMNAQGITEEQLEAEREIPTDFGQTLSWKYLCWAREHPVRAICDDTAILYATGDSLIPRKTIDRFVDGNPCSLTILNGGEHWLHTNEQLDFMKKWEERELKK